MVNIDALKRSPRVEEHKHTRPFWCLSKAQGLVSSLLGLRFGQHFRQTRDQPDYLFSSQELIHVRPVKRPPMWNIPHKSNHTGCPWLLMSVTFKMRSGHNIIVRASTKGSPINHFSLSSALSLHRPRSLERPRTSP